MTTISRRAENWPVDVGRWLLPAALVIGLATIVAGRWWATRVGLDPLAVGAAYGLALAGLTFAGVRAMAPPASRTPSMRPRLTSAVRAAIVGLGFGLVIVAATVAGPILAGSGHIPGLGRPASPFLPWVAVTILVATSQETLLRGILFDRVSVAGGTLQAVALTTAIFALIHVPLYGWHVVPLDLAVGLGFAGLRLATRSVAAPAAAHSVADLATWWL